jgi:aryl-alcohol dehydrogenase-like predicted oxidoreductase
VVSKDTSDLYADNEDMLGEWFKKTGRRNEIFLASKFANTTDKEGRRIVRGDPE